MKKALTICLITIVVLALISGAACCGLIFSNDMLLYNALRNDTDKLATHYGKATTEFSSATYHDISFVNTTDNVTSNVIVYENGEDLTAKLTFNNCDEVYTYKSSGELSTMVYDNGTTKSEKSMAILADMIVCAINTTDKDIPYIHVFATEFADMILLKQFDNENFMKNIFSVEPLVDLSVPMMGVKYTLNYKNTLGETMYIINATIDNYFNFTELSVNINNQLINVIFNKVNSTSVLTI